MSAQKTRPLTELADEMPAELQQHAARMDALIAAFCIGMLLGLFVVGVA